MVFTEPIGFEEGVKLFAAANKIALIGTGGNLAIAQHMASDIYRHTDKFCFAPDSVNLTALGGDHDWKEPWIDYAEHTADLIIAITCRTNSHLVRVLEQINTKVLLIAPSQDEYLPTIVIDDEYYHEFEIRALWTIYMLMHYNGVDLPKLP
tara:strand:- start:1476 stop:1928 length:453 start_codon:yes stop_codon:yes gene_type:complete